MYEPSFKISKEALLVKRNETVFNLTSSKQACTAQKEYYIFNKLQQAQKKVITMIELLKCAGRDSS